MSRKVISHKDCKSCEVSRKHINESLRLVTLPSDCCYVKSFRSNRLVFDIRGILVIAGLSVGNDLNKKEVMQTLDQLGPSWRRFRQRNGVHCYWKHNVDIRGDISCLVSTCVYTDLSFELLSYNPGLPVHLDETLNLCKEVYVTISETWKRAVPLFREY